MTFNQVGVQEGRAHTVHFSQCVAVLPVPLSLALGIEFRGPQLLDCSPLLPVACCFDRLQEPPSLGPRSRPARQYSITSPPPAATSLRPLAPSASSAPSSTTSSDAPAPAASPTVHASRAASPSKRRRQSKASSLPPRIAPASATGASAATSPGVAWTSPPAPFATSSPATATGSIPPPGFAAPRPGTPAPGARKTPSVGKRTAPTSNA